jgi:glucokinase
MYLVGVDIGGTKSAVTLGIRSEESIKILGKRSFATAEHSPDGLMEHMIRAIGELRQEYGLTGEEPAGIGISCGGPLDSRKGRILSPPNLPGWDDIPVTEHFRLRLGVPVYLQNDANACALAEWKYGAGRGCGNLVFLTFGTGLGAGLILDGRLYNGTCDMAGEIGHIRLESTGPTGYGKSGSMEGYCSGAGIAQIGRSLLESRPAGEAGGLEMYRSHPERLTAKNLADLAELGDTLALEAYRISARKLGQGLSILIDILNPERIVIGSVFARSENLFRCWMQEVIDREALERSRRICKIVPAELGEAVGDYAALAIATGEW